MLLRARCAPHSTHAYERIIAITQATGIGRAAACGHQLRADTPKANSPFPTALSRQRPRDHFVTWERAELFDSFLESSQWQMRRL